jgi:hypothetical protein
VSVKSFPERELRVDLLMARSPESEFRVPENVVIVELRVERVPESVLMDDWIPVTTPERAFCARVSV